MSYIKNYPLKTGVCEFGNCNQEGIYRRQNTQYAEDELNFSCYCHEHQEEVDEYWKEMWKDYYNSVL